MRCSVNLLVVVSILTQILIGFYTVKGFHFWKQSYRETISATPSLQTARPFSTQMAYDPCNYYRYDDTPGRSVENHQRGWRTDYPSNTWLALTLRGKRARIATACPFRFINDIACGSAFAGWMEGNHPSVYEGIQYRTVCFATQHCYCQYKGMVAVRNCGTFFIYRFMTNQRNIGYCAVADTQSSYSHHMSILFSSVEMTSMRSFAPSPFTASITSGLAPSPVPDPCFSYRILSDASRYFYKQSFGDACDSRLHGWYRFTLDGQNAQMATSRTYSFSKGACGSRLALYMLGSHPTTNEGIQSRSVCFTKNTVQDCFRFKGISVKNCGQYFVYHLQGVVHCPARYCSDVDDERAVQNFTSKNGVIKSPDRGHGNYGDNEHIDYFIPQANGRSIRLDFIQFDLERRYDTLKIYRFMEKGNKEVVEILTGNLTQFSLLLRGNLLLSFRSDDSNTGKGFLIHYSVESFGTLKCYGTGMAFEFIQFKNITMTAMFRNKNCSVSLSGSMSYWPVLYTEYGDCGTTLNHTGSEAKYHNEVDLFLKENGRFIYIGTISVSCRIQNNVHVVSWGSQEVKHVMDVKEGKGQYDLVFRMYKDKHYSQRYTYRDFPVKVKPWQILYYELELQQKRQGATLVVNRCYQSPSSSESGGKTVDLILNGCAVNSSVAILPRFSQTVVRFKTKALRLMGYASLQFIHCDVYVCFPSSREQYCNSTCQPVRYSSSIPNLIRLKRSTDSFGSTTKVYTLSQGPIVTKENN